VGFMMDNRNLNSYINPATGLPMVGDVDIKGNLYGTGSFHANNTYPQNNEVYEDNNENENDEDISNLEFAIFILSLILFMGLFYYMVFK
jgi:hypothetical protein